MTLLQSVAELSPLKPYNFFASVTYPKKCLTLEPHDLRRCFVVLATHRSTDKVLDCDFYIITTLIILRVPAAI